MAKQIPNAKAVMVERTTQGSKPRSTPTGAASAWKRAMEPIKESIEARGIPRSTPRSSGMPDRDEEYGCKDLPDLHLHKNALFLLHGMLKGCVWVNI